MNRKSFGEKCTCSHFENEHQSVKKMTSNESVTRDYSYIIAPAEFPLEFSRGKCKICDCSSFEPKKKKWWSR